jgi:hypothetical protein
VVESEPTTEIGHQTPRSAMLLLSTSQAFIRDSPGDRYVIMGSRYLLNHVIVQSSQVTITRNRTVTERLFVHPYGEFWSAVLPNPGQCQAEMILQRIQLPCQITISLADRSRRTSGNRIHTHFV